MSCEFPLNEEEARTDVVHRKGWGRGRGLEPGILTTANLNPSIVFFSSGTSIGFFFMISTFLLKFLCNFLKVLISY